jgi:hypothetical protein
MASPATAARERIKDVIAAEFTAEGWTATDDKFGRSKGMGEPHTEASISVTPDYERERPGRALLLDVGITVQFYLGYDAEPDETISRDSTIIEGYADRFRSQFEGAGCRVDDGDAWYLRLTNIEYPEDPTGNKTRFEALVVGQATNRAAMPSA